MDKLGLMMMRYLKILVVFIILGFAAYSGVNYYGYIFSRDVKGTLVKVERIQLNLAIMQATPGAKVSPELFSFAVAVKDAKSDEIVTASAEDRQWAVAQPGQCVEARFYPYPPWDLEKSGTYHGARLLKLLDCPSH